MLMLVTITTPPRAPPAPLPRTPRIRLSHAPRRLSGRWRGLAAQPDDRQARPSLVVRRRARRAGALAGGGVLGLALVVAGWPLHLPVAGSWVWFSLSQGGQLHLPVAGSWVWFSLSQGGQLHLPVAGSWVWFSFWPRVASCTCRWRGLGSGSRCRRVASCTCRWRGLGSGSRCRRVASCTCRWAGSSVLVLVVAGWPAALAGGGVLGLVLVVAGWPAALAGGGVLGLVLVVAGWPAALAGGGVLGLVLVVAGWPAALAGGGVLGLVLVVAGWPAALAGGGVLGLVLVVAGWPAALAGGVPDLTSRSQVGAEGSSTNPRDRRGSDAEPRARLPVDWPEPRCTRCSRLLAPSPSRLEASLCNRADASDRSSATTSGTATVSGPSEHDQVDFAPLVQRRAPRGTWSDTRASRDVRVRDFPDLAPHEAGRGQLGLCAGQVHPDHVRNQRRPEVETDAGQHDRRVREPFGGQEQDPGLRSRGVRREGHGHGAGSSWRDVRSRACRRVAAEGRRRRRDRCRRDAQWAVGPVRHGHGLEED